MTVGELREYVRQALGWIVRFAPVAKSSASGEDDEVEGHKTEGSGEASHQIGVRRLWPFGLRSVPPAGVDAVVVHANGGSGNGVMVGAESKRFGPSDLKDGETALYCKVEGALTKLDENGDHRISAAAGRRVLVNGGGKGAARKDHKVGFGTLHFLAAGSTSITSLTITYTPGDGSSPETVTLNPSGQGTITIREKIAEGSVSIELKAD